MIFNIVAQGVGLVATLLVAVTYVKNTRTSMLAFQFTASLVFVIHYLLLNAYTGAVLSLLVAVRCLVYWKYGKDRLSVVLFMLAFGVSGLFSWQGIHSILPIIGSVLFSLAFWFKSPKSIRLFSIAPSCCWGLYGIVTGSWGGLLTELFCLGSIVVGILRYDLKVKYFNKNTTNVGGLE